MLRSTIRILFAAVMTLSMTLGVFAGVGTTLASAAGSQAVTASGYYPVASLPTGVNYCYPSGYNRQGWRCGWRLAQAPYNLGSYYNRYYYGGYYNNYYGNYNPYYNSGYGGRGPYPVINDYGGLPRFGPYYYNYNYNGYYNNCYYSQYC